jgi:flagellin-like protein
MYGCVTGRFWKERWLGCHMNYVSSAGWAPKRIPCLVEEPDLMYKTVTRGTSQRGITGLETAIILIAVVVVASVFAFTVLSTGIFTSERSKETIFAGIAKRRRALSSPVVPWLPTRQTAMAWTPYTSCLSSFLTLSMGRRSN